MLITLASDETNKKEMSLEVEKWSTGENEESMATLWVASNKATVTLKYNNQRNDNQPNTYKNCWERDEKFSIIASKVVVFKASKLTNTK